MKSMFSKSTRGAAYAAPRRLISLVLMLALLVSTVMPVFALNNPQIALTADFLGTDPSGNCTITPSVFAEGEDALEMPEGGWPVYYLLVNESQISRTTVGSCFYDFTEGDEWPASAPISYDSRATDTYYVSATENYNSAASSITLNSITLKNEADHLLFFVCDDSAEYIAYLLVEWVAGGGTLTEEQKAPLSNLLATVADGNDKYVQSGDRYNGKPADTITSKNGSFWAEFTAANGPRATAQKALQDAKTEADIKAAVAELQAAISKLIPTSQLNATYLYETLQQYNYSDEYLDDFTAPSVRKFRAARSAAQSYLDSLFNTDGSAKEDVNIAANQKTANDYADALKSSSLVSNDSVEESKVNLRTIQALAKKYAMTENGRKLDSV